MRSQRFGEEHDEAGSDVYPGICVVMVHSFVAMRRHAGTQRLWNVNHPVAPTHPPPPHSPDPHTHAHPTHPMRVRYRHQVGIAVSGSNVAPPAATFSDIAFPSDAIREAVLGNIEDLEFSEPTAVQVHAHAHAPSLCHPMRSVIKSFSRLCMLAPACRKGVCMPVGRPLRLVWARPCACWS
jgi:hypothetical protein